MTGWYNVIFELSISQTEIKKRVYRRECYEIVLKMNSIELLKT